MNGTALLVIAIAIIVGFGLGVVGDYYIAEHYVLHGPSDPEYNEYLSIRDYSNCTKANDSVCCCAGCIHTYRQCQINHCGSEGIGW